MTTTMVGNSGKRVAVTVEQKARALRVFEINEAGKLACTSGSDPKSAYVVSHNGKHSTGCPCASYTPRCAHRIATDWYLEARNRAAYLVSFNPCNVA